MSEPVTPYTTERPLHVLVAEALGTLHILGPTIGKTDDGRRSIRRCTLHPNETYAYEFVTDHDGRVVAPRYDTDWCAAGQMIEALRLSVRAAAGGSWAARKDEPERVGQEYHGATPLIAACNLIVALAVAGKLEGRVC